jgi:hypothetical protein
MTNPLNAKDKIYAMATLNFVREMKSYFVDIDNGAHAKYVSTTLIDDGSEHIHFDVKFNDSNSRFNGEYSIDVNCGYISLLFLNDLRSMKGLSYLNDLVPVDSNELGHKRVIKLALADSGSPYVEPSGYADKDKWTGPVSIISAISECLAKPETLEYMQKEGHDIEFLKGDSVNVINHHLWYSRGKSKASASAHAGATEALDKELNSGPLSVNLTGALDNLSKHEIDFVKDKPIIDAIKSLPDNKKYQGKLANKFPDYCLRKPEDF